MTLPETQKNSGATSRTTGIASESISDGGGYLGSEIDNSTNKDTEADILVTYETTATPDAYLPLKVYLIYAPDGTNYEDGDNSIEPTAGALIGVAPSWNDSAETHRYVIRNIRLRPFPMKLLAWNDTGVSQEVTLNLYSSNLQVID